MEARRKAERENTDRYRQLEVDGAVLATLMSACLERLERFVFLNGSLILCIEPPNRAYGPVVERPLLLDRG